MFTTAAFAATTATFFGGFKDYSFRGDGTIKIELTNISSQKNVIISETQALEYFDDAAMIDLVIDYDYDEEEVISIKDILANYNNYNGGVPIYYADVSPVVITAKTPLRTLYYYYQGNVPTDTFEPRYYTYDDYIHNFVNKQVYTEQPKDDWLLADGTKVTLNAPGKYLFVVLDDGINYNRTAGVFCVHIGEKPSEIPVTENINATPTASTVLVNGKAVEFEAYNINGYNYFKLRDLAQAVNNTEKNFEVTWDGAKNAINLISNKSYTPIGGELAKGDGKTKVATPTASKIYKDGEEISLTAYNINGYNYFKLRDIAKIFDIGVTWDGATNTIGIDTSIGYVE